jgi:hypothetical protein
MCLPLAVTPRYFYTSREKFLNTDCFTIREWYVRWHAGLDEHFERADQLAAVKPNHTTVLRRSPAREACA